MKTNRSSEKGVVTVSTVKSLDLLHRSIIEVMASCGDIEIKQDTDKVQS